MSVCLFVSNVSNCGTYRDPREGFWMIKILNICLHQNSIFIKFLKILKIPKICCENPRIIFVLFYDVHKENMFTINLEDGREAPSKASFPNCWSYKGINIVSLLIASFFNIKITIKVSLNIWKGSVQDKNVLPSRYFDHFLGNF